MSYMLSTEAKQDLETIKHYTLAIWGAEQAERYFVGILKAFELLSEWPAIGQERHIFNKTVLVYFISNMSFTILNKVVSS